MRSPFLKRHFNIEPTNLNQTYIRASGQLRIAPQTNLSCTKTARSHCTRCAHRVPCEARFLKRHFNIEPTNLNQSDTGASGQLRIAPQTNISCTKTARSQCTRCAHRVPCEAPFFKRHFNIEPTNLNQTDMGASGQLRIALQTNLSCAKTARSHYTRCAHRVPCEARFSNVISTLNPQISINLI
jgi:hypothetical protein